MAPPPSLAVPYLAVCLLVLAAAQNPPFSAGEMAAIERYMMGNVDPSGTCVGCVLASPSTGSATEPDYFYYWRRDGGITMDTVVSLSLNSSRKYDRQIRDYVQWVKKTQLTPPNPGYDIMGEPKFFVSGLVYNKPWMRPQNDGAALEAIAMMHYANALLEGGNANDRAYVMNVMYQSSLNTPSIKWNLEFTAHHWMDKCGDPWEEIFGDHFFTKIVQRKALIDGAAFAARVGDTTASTFYSQQAAAMTGPINAHWVPSTGVINETLGATPGFDKTDGLDSAVYLGAIYGDCGDGFYTPTSERVRSTAAKFRSYFATAQPFPINLADDNAGVPGILVGRYPNDMYDGIGRGPGNPWILCSFALGQIYYMNGQFVANASELAVTRENVEFFSQALEETPLAGVLSVNQVLTRENDADTLAVLADALVSMGDGMLLRVRRHTIGNNNHFNEELDKNTGYEWGARDLSWSYATLFTAMAARSSALEAMI